MKELHPSGDGWTPKEVAHESRLQYGEDNYSLYPDARRELYKYADDGRDLWLEIQKDLKLAGAESIIDIGASRGQFIKQLWESGHRGYMLGIDINRHVSLEPNEYLENLGAIPHVNYDFEVGDAAALPVSEDVADRGSCLFGVYHFPNPVKAVRELSRAVKSEGLIAVSTRDVDNLAGLWELGGKAADRVGAPRPKSFYSHCDISKTEKILRDLDLKILVKKVQDTGLSIPFHHDEGDGEGFRDLRQAILSLRPDMIRTFEDQVPSGASLQQIIDADIKEEVMEEIEANNGFYKKIRIKQAYYIVKNTKKS